jgi:hypothetical protein
MLTSKIDGRLRTSKDRYRNVLKFFNGETQNITPSMFRIAIQSNIGLSLHDEQILTLFSFFDETKTGLINLNHFLEQLYRYENPVGEESTLESIGKASTMSDMNNSKRTSPTTNVLLDKATALKFARKKMDQIIRTDKDRLKCARNLLFDKCIKEMNEGALIDAFAKLNVSISEAVAKEILVDFSPNFGLEALSVINFLILFLNDTSSDGSVKDSWIDKSEIAAVVSVHLFPTTFLLI